MADYATLQNAVVQLVPLVIVPVFNKSVGYFRK